MGVRLSKQVDKEEVAVGSHHVSLAHKLVYLVGCGLCDLVLVLDDVVGDIDGVVVATPAKRHRCALLTEVVPCPDIEIRVVVLGLSRDLAQRYLVAAKRSQTAVLREVLIFVCEQRPIFLARLGNDLARGCDVKEAVAACHHHRCQQHDDALKYCFVHCLHSVLKISFSLF